MEPISTAMLIKATESKALSSAISYIGNNVLAKIRDRRIDGFLNCLCEEYRKEQDIRGASGDLDLLLMKIDESELHQEAIFSAYRRVALSASKLTGPRVIALLTAKLLLEDRDATQEEESIFTAAESFSDREFRELLSWWESESGKTVSLSSFFDGDFTTPPMPPFSTITLSTFGDEETSPVNLYRYFGSFAAKLENVGMVYQEIKTTHIPQTRSEPSHQQIERKLHVENQLHIFAELAKRAIVAGGYTRTTAE